MRPLKFRAWDKERKKMAIVMSLVEPEQAPYCLVKFAPNATSVAILTNKLEIMQFTGLHDKNGKGEELWQADIVGMFQGTQRSEIFWDDEAGVWAVWAQLSGDSPVRKELLSNVLSTAEKLGNKYEHPHLLEKENHNGKETNQKEAEKEGQKIAEEKTVQD